MRSRRSSSELWGIYLEPLRTRSVALFVLLAGATWARIVPAYFFSGHARSISVRTGRSARRTRHLQFALLLLFELALQLIDGGCWSLSRNRNSRCMRTRLSVTIQRQVRLCWGGAL